MTITDACRSTRPKSFLFDLRLVLAGLGSMSGTLAAGLILGIAESLVLMFLGASWAPAVSFGLLLLVLGVRPQGLFGR